METTNEKGKLTIKLPKQIKADNCDAFSQEFNEILKKEDFMRLVIDAGELEYISSAGLRVLLATKSDTQKPIDITNTSEEVYEIFDVTGLTTLFTVHRKPKDISIEGCRIIGQGTFGTVYKLDDDRVVKVYNTDRKVSMERIEQEKNLSRDVFVKGIPTAMSYQIVNTGEYYGLVFEMLDATTLLDYMLTHRDEADEMTDKSCEILKKLHSSELSADSQKTMKNLLLGLTMAVKDYFTEDEMNRFRTFISGVPNRMTMIHGDYHPGNIMVDKNKELMLIDVGDICTGHPFFEFFDMYPAFLLGDEVEYGREMIDAQVAGFLHLKKGDDFADGLEFMRQYWNRVLHTYFDGCAEEEIEMIDEYIRAFGRFKQFVTVTHLPDRDPEAKKREIQKNKERFFEEFDRIPPIDTWWPKN